MNTAESIITEAHKAYPKLEVDLNWKPIDSMDDRKAFLFSPKYNIGISLGTEGSCFCDYHNGEKIFVISGYVYARYFYYSNGWPSASGYWKFVSYFEGSEKEARDAVLEFCYKLDTRTNILHAGLNFFPTTCRMDDYKGEHNEYS